MFIKSVIKFIVQSTIFLSILFNTLFLYAEQNFHKIEYKICNVEDEQNFLFQFYKNYISPADGNRCSMYPSCSRYGEQAIKKHGFFMGWIMSCDRLIRCGRDEVNISDHIKNPQDFNGKILTPDSLESNDFWWYPYDSSD